jgi:Starter unit:ACP transacylase in aflatoxin biosynthesis
MVVIPVFAGVGTSAAASPHYREQAIVLASSPLGSLLLSSCYHAFTTELVSLPVTDLELIDIDISAFSAPASLLSFQNSRNAVISNSFLFLTQSLRYLAYVESTTPNSNELSFSAILQSNARYNIGIPGFSLGILPACLVASSASTLSYITHAIELFKVALWIGVRVQMHRVQTLAKNRAIATCRPWSLVFTGIDKEKFQTILLKFNDKAGGAPIKANEMLITSLQPGSRRSSVCHCCVE